MPALIEMKKKGKGSKILSKGDLWYTVVEDKNLEQK